MTSDSSTYCNRIGKILTCHFAKNKSSFVVYLEGAELWKFFLAFVCQRIETEVHIHVKFVCSLWWYYIRINYGIGYQCFNHITAKLEILEILLRFVMATPSVVFTINAKFDIYVIFTHLINSKSLVYKNASTKIFTSTRRKFLKSCCQFDNLSKPFSKINVNFFIYKIQIASASSGKSGITS